MTKSNPKGAGRKPISKRYSDALKSDIHRALRKKAEETNQTLGEVVINLCYDDDPSKQNLRMVALKLVQEVLLIKETQSTNDINVAKTDGPVIGLPPIKKTIPVAKQEKEGVALH